MTFQEAVNKIFATGLVPDGYNGNRAKCGFAWDPQSKLVLHVFDFGYCASPYLPPCDSQEEAAWMLQNHPLAKEYITNYKEINPLKVAEVKEPRLFIGHMATGISYCDREVEEDADYKKLAFLPYDTLELEIRRGCPLDLQQAIIADARTLQGRKGEHYQVTTSGQTVLLGSKP
ncbi:MAG: hypothetical protein WC291_00490 [Thermodesulfovibrionales bacterium]|jgi:hypothetical protein